ncbi:hypothetical protein EON65_21790 [archaeon]|nr:MAG: hypothetical protein EON65_21790 [archaeon]
MIYPCSTPAQALMIAAAQIYVTLLTYLFYKFYQASYGKKKKDGKKSE